MTCPAAPFLGADFRYGSNSEVGARNRHVRFPPDSYQTADIAGGPVRATEIRRRNRHLFEASFGTTMRQP
jgi:hypothetical protein